VSDEATADVVIDSLKLEGESAPVGLIEAITDARVKRAMHEVPMLTLPC
jgi:hypothetical protein